MSDIIEYRLGATLKFDSSREKYAVDRLDKLSSTHSLGQFLKLLILVVFDDPKQLNTEGNMYSLINKMNETGMTPNASEFFNKANKNISDMQNKVDEIYNMCLKIYTLALFGKTLGITDKSKNSAKAEFILEKQIKDLCNTLGVSDNIFESAKIINVEDKSSEILEYIIEHYDNIVTEIKADLTIDKQVKEKIENTELHTKVDEIKIIAKDNSIIAVESPEVKSDDTGEQIDFGDSFGKTADMSALKSFWGGNKSE